MMTCLVPYIFTSMAELMIFVKDRARFSGQKMLGFSVIAVLAFLYSLWAIAGSGRDTVYWGFLLLLTGVPVYVWIKWRHGEESKIQTEIS